MVVHQDIYTQNKREKKLKQQQNTTLISNMNIDTFELQPFPSTLERLFPNAIEKSPQNKCISQLTED